MTVRSDVLADEVGYLVKEAQAVLHARMDEQLRPLGLTVAQYACLLALRQTPGITSSELARRAFVSRQSMNVLLQGLHERGLVQRDAEPGPHGQRAAELAAPSAALLEQAKQRVDLVVARMVGDLDRGQLAALRDALASCRDSLAAQ